MNKLHNKAMLLTAAAAIALLPSSCAEDGGFGDDWYFVTTKSIADYYFRPITLNITSKWDGSFKADGSPRWNVIYGDWFANASNGYNSDAQNDGSADSQKTAERFYFIDKQNIKKYFDLIEDFHREVLIAPGDIISPYKEYAEYYGDTLLMTAHEEGLEICNVCVLPITGISVTCDKDFDKSHPAGSNLGDIMFWSSMYDLYGALHDVDENGEPRNNGLSADDFFRQSGSIKSNIPLSSIPEHPLMMTGDKFYLKINRPPSEPGTYEFTVKFTFGPDPLSGEVVDVPPAKVRIDFAAD